MPLGWHISVFKQQNEGTAPACAGASPGTQLAVWQANVRGLDWLDALVRQQRAILLGGDGYPVEYTAKAQDVVSRLRGEPPEANARWTVGEEDIIFPGWPGRTVKDAEVIRACRPDECVLIQAWDES